jgi:hypothetical protein
MIRCQANVKRIWTATFALALFTTPCFAGNRGSAFLSNQAAMMGEAVVASIDDAGAAWYNPAGLVSLDQTSLDLSASAFVLRHYRIPHAAVTRVGDAPPVTESASFTEVISVPSALTYVRALGPDVTAAVGVFVPDAEDVEVAARFDTGSAGGTSYRWDLSAARRTSTYLAGPALGWRLSPAVRVGASTFLSYSTNRSSRVFQATFETSDPGGIAGSVQSLERTSRRRHLGWVSSVGVQVDAGAGWSLGATLRTPHWAVGALEDQRESTHGAAVEGGSTPVAGGRSTSSQHRATTFEPYQAPRITLGVAKQVGEGWVSAEGDLEPALTNANLGIERRPTWNLRAGARHPVSPTVMLGGGVFTDRSPEAEPAVLGDIRTHFYGASVGAQFRTAYALREEPGHVAFTSTIALRYARGTGHVGGLRFDPTSAPVLHQAEVTVHEVGVHVGSSVEF